MHSIGRALRIPAIRGAAVAAAMLAALTAASIGPASAAPGAAAHGVVVHAPAGSAVRASLAAVSCKGSSWCMAVGSYTDRSQVRHALAQIWNGKKWRVLRNLPGHALTSVSCSAAWFCMAAGGPTGAERWNGTVWRTMTSPRGGVNGVSCGSRKLCMVIFNGLVRSWNGTRWRLWRHATDVCSGGPPGPCGLASVSCGSATDCVAVGTQQISNTEQDTVGVAWNGTRWARTFPPNNGNPAAMNVISCARAFCMAPGSASSDVQMGTIALAGTWNATTKSWTDVSPDLGVLCPEFHTCFWAHVISCANSASCMTFGPSGNQDWNGTAWKAAPSISAGRGSNLGAVSCGGSICMGVGYRTIAGARRTLAELWNGTSWRILPTPKVG
jgi:hypothetical protein